MAYATKYKIEFKDQLNASWKIEMLYPNYTGSITDIIAGENPLIISEGKGSDDMFEPLRTSSIKFNVYFENYNAQFIDDISNIEDNVCYVKVSNDNNYIGHFWLQQQVGERSFSEVNYEIQLVAIDFLSAIKGKLFIENGMVLYGRRDLYSIINLCLNKNYVEGVPQITVYSTDTFVIDKTNETLEDRSIFEQIEISSESFNNSDGRPQDCYDIVRKIISSFGLYGFMDGNKFTIADPVDRAINKGSVQPNIFFKEQNISQNFLVGNNESILRTKAVKEVSTIFNYNQSNGLLKDGFFSDWNLQTNTLNQWTVWNNGTFTKLGNGRPENPFGIKIGNRIELINGIHFNNFTILRGYTYRNIKSQSYLSIKVKLRFQDYKKYEYQLAYLQIGFLLKSITGKIYHYWYENGDATKNFKWQEMPKDGNGNYIRNEDTFQNSSGLYTGKNIELNSDTNIKEASFDINKLPDEGIVYVYLKPNSVSPINWDDLYNNQTRQDTIFYSVILSEKPNTEVTNSKGKKIYLQQSGNYIGKFETKEIFLNTSTNESIAGALYSKYQLNGNVNLTQGQILTDIEKKFINIGRSTLQEMLTKYILFFYRIYRNQIDRMTILCNTLNYNNLIKINSANLSNAVYVQITRDWNVKDCLMDIRAIELNGEFKNISELECNSYNDLIERYDIFD